MLMFNNPVSVEPWEPCEHGNRPSLCQDCDHGGKPISGGSARSRIEDWRYEKELMEIEGSYDT